MFELASNHDCFCYLVVFFKSKYSSRIWLWVKQEQSVLFPVSVAKRYKKKKKEKSNHRFVKYRLEWSNRLIVCKFFFSNQTEKLSSTIVDEVRNQYITRWAMTPMLFASLILYERKVSLLFLHISTI